MDMTGYPDRGAEGGARHIRRYRQGDLRAFEKFWNAQGGPAFAAGKVRAFLRLVEGNPFSSASDDYLVLEQEGRVAGYEGLMPFRFSISGLPVDGFIYHDTLVDREMRGRGVGRKLVASVLKDHPEFSIAVWMNAPNMKVFEKCGWLPVEDIPTYVRGYSVRNMVNTRFPLINSAVTAAASSLIVLLYRLEKKIADYSCGDYAIELVGRFDERIDALFHAVKHEFPFIAYRTGEVLNWKFTDGPSCRFSRMVCTRGGEMKGYLVFRTRDAQDGRRIATIYDFLCSPRETDVFRVLMRQAILEIEKARPDTLEMLCTGKRFARMLKRMGFVRARENPGALKFVHAESNGIPEGIGNGGSWFYTFGDGDKVFWDFDPAENRTDTP